MFLLLSMQHLAQRHSEHGGLRAYFRPEGMKLAEDSAVCLADVSECNGLKVGDFVTFAPRNLVPTVAFEQPRVAGGVDFNDEVFGERYRRYSILNFYEVPAKVRGRLYRFVYCTCAVYTLERGTDLAFCRDGRQDKIALFWIGSLTKAA